MNNEAMIFVVDDDAAMRHSLAWLMESAGLPVQTFASAEDFLAQVDPWQVRMGCLLLDVRMPGMSGLELQAHLARDEVGLPIILITGHGDVPMAVEAMRAGAFDFIEKPFNDEDLLRSIQQALDLQARDRVQRIQRAEIQARLATLTPREHEVMEQVVAGRANKEIASALGVSVKTVEAHRAKVMDKMNAHSLAELVRMYLTTQQPTCRR